MFFTFRSWKNMENLLLQEETEAETTEKIQYSEILKTNNCITAEKQ